MAEKLTYELVRRLFDYDRSGVLIWRVDKNTAKVKGRPAGTVSGKGRLMTSIDGTLYHNHSIIFLWHTGQLPEAIDHINRNPLDNRIENLRPATNIENSRNRRPWGSVGFKGVVKRPGGKFQAQIRVNGTKITLGTFSAPDRAAEAYDTAAIKYFGEFACTNKDLGLL